MITENINAVHSADMEEYLRTLGVLDDVVEGCAQCAVCGATVALATIAGLYPEDKDVRFVCTSPKCIDALLERRRVCHD